MTFNFKDKIKRYISEEAFLIHPNAMVMGQRTKSYFIEPTGHVDSFALTTRKGSNKLMKKLALILLTAILYTTGFSQVIIYPQSASVAEKLAAKEVRRYLYLRTDQKLPVQAAMSLPSSGDVILVANDHNPMVDNLRNQINQTTTAGGIIIKSVSENGRTVLVITGNNAESTLIAAYRFAEHLGIGFDFSGDAIPDVKIPLSLTGFDEAGARRFETTGYLPFHDFLPGPDIWSTDDYLVIINQLAKMGMNFIGLHNYPTYGIQEEVAEDRRQGSEPNVWIGLPEDVNPDGTVNWAFPAYYRHSHSPHRIWGTTELNTSEYWAGSADIFPRDFWGSDVFGTTAMPTDVSGYAEVFNNTGRMFNQAFGFAKQIGVKTALGTELPLGIEAEGPEVDEAWIRGMPLELQERLDNPGDPDTVKEVYKGIFDRIMKAHDLDYFWLWSYEIWSYYGFNEDQVEAIKADMNLALQAAEEMDVPFKLGHAGWISGSGDDPAEFDDVLPKDHPHYVLWDEAQGMEALSDDRVKWAATWTEEDWGLVQPQINVQRVYKDVKAALEKNCQGLIGKGWRNRAVAMNTHAMRHAFWAYGPTGEEVDMAFPTDESAWIDEVYLDWATRWFGAEVAQDITNILAPMDKGGEPRQPNICEWDTDLEDSNSAGSVIVGQVNDMSDFDFIDDIESLEPNVVGQGNQERFKYLLKMYQSFRAKAEFGTFKEEGDDGRAEAAEKMHEIITLDLERMVDACDVGEVMHNNVMNWHQMIQNVLEPGPDPSKTYTGEAFVKVMPLRTQVDTDEELTLRIIAMLAGTPTLHYRELGGSTWTSTACTNEGRSVYRVTIPAQTQDFEYYIESGTQYFPVTANADSPIFQTVVVKGSDDMASTNSLQSKQPKIKIYPNPSNGHYKVDLGSMHHSVEVTITNIFGQLIQQVHYDNARFFDFEIEGPSAIYLVNIESKDKKTVVRVFKE